MANWIKVEVTTPDKPEVARLSTLLGLDPDAVVGKLVRLWAWADAQCEDGNTLGVTSAFLDRLTYCPGFTNALIEVGWMTGTEENFTLPDFDRHNGKSAKQRASTARRVELHRKCNGSAVTDVTEAPLPNPLPDKSKSKSIKALSPAREAGGKIDGVAPPPSPGADRPTQAQVRAAAANLMIPERVADLFFDDMEGCGWIDAKNRPVQAWQNALKAFASRFDSNERERLAAANARSAMASSRRAGVMTAADGISADPQTPLPADHASQGWLPRTD